MDWKGSLKQRPGDCPGDSEESPLVVTPGRGTMKKKWLDASAKIRDVGDEGQEMSNVSQDLDLGEGDDACK